MKKHFQQGLYFIYFFGGMSFFSTNSHGADTSSLKGFYLGYTLGYSIAPISFDQTAIQIAVDGGVDSLVGEIGRGYSKNKNLEFFFGYNHIFRKMYFGGEIFLDLVHSGQKKILNDINNQILLSIKRNSFGFGLLGKIGYLFYQDIGVYVGLSLKSTSFTLKSIDLFPARGGIASQSQRNHKMRLHIGAEALFFRYIGGRISYAYTPKNRILALPPSNHIFGTNAYKNPFIRAKWNEHFFGLSIFYKF